MASFEKRKGRLIKVDGVNWKWQMSKKLGVVAYCETGEKRYAHADVLTGGDVDRGQWKRTSDGEVRPRQVANWLRGNQPYRESRKLREIFDSEWED